MPVVVGEIGAASKRKILALGETPNIAARIQGQAAPNEVVISAATYRFVEGLFECEDRGQPELKGVSTPLTLYRVIKESEAQSRFEVVERKGLTPLDRTRTRIRAVTRRWEQAKSGAGQVVLLSGEPGIGKSRLVQELKEHLSNTKERPALSFAAPPITSTVRCIPSLTTYSVCCSLQREDLPTTKLDKTREQCLATDRFPQAETLPLLAALLSLPHPEGYPPITLSPQKQKEKTHAALVAWIVEEAKKAAVYCAWEDLHWADPSTLELLNLFLDQAPDRHGCTCC